jgi:hypothetical protein
MAAATVTDSEVTGHQTDSRFTVASNGSRFQPAALERYDSTEPAVPDATAAAVAAVAVVPGAAPTSPFAPGGMTVDRMLQIEAENNDRGYQAARMSRKQQQQRRVS